MSDGSSVTDPKPEERRSLIEKIGPALPIGLTALAAVFGSMSAGVLQQAMYWKSQAAQDQSKSTNQWTLAGFKRDRSLMMQGNAAQLRAMSGYARASFSVPSNAKPELERAAEWLSGKGPPKAELPKIEDPGLIELLDMIRTRKPEEEILKKASTIQSDVINKAIDNAEDANKRVDDEWDPSVKAASALVSDQTIVKPDEPEREKKLANATAAQAAGFEMEQRRYRAESGLNQGIGFLYDARVKISTAESDRHRKKSATLSYAMLIAQIGAVASSLALARKKQGMIWVFAAMVGIVAIGFGGSALIPPGLLPF